MPHHAVTDLLSAAAYLRREKRRCERRLAELRALLVADQEQRLPARHDRSTTGWTEEKRLAVSRRMRAYWAARRNDEEPATANHPSSLLTARGREGLRPPPVTS